MSMEELRERIKAEGLYDADYTGESNNHIPDAGEMPWDNVYDEVDDEPRRPRFRWEYVNCNDVPVPEYVEDDEVVNPSVIDKEDDEEA